MLLFIVEYNDANDRRMRKINRSLCTIELWLLLTHIIIMYVETSCILVVHLYVWLLYLNTI